VATDWLSANDKEELPLTPGSAAEAIEALVAGKRVKRACWGAMYVALCDTEFGKTLVLTLPSSQRRAPFSFAPQDVAALDWIEV